LSPVAGPHVSPAIIYKLSEPDTAGDVHRSEL
jgi:hypothetical protein